MNHTLIVMMGVAGSGKSTLANNIAKTHDDCIIVSRDDIRFALLQPEENYFAHESEVKQKYYQTISDMLLVHKYVIADATQLTLKSRAEFFNRVKYNKNVRIIGIWIETDKKTAFKQNNARTGLRRVPEKVIEDMYKYKVSPIQEEPFDDIIYISAHTNQSISRLEPTVEDILDKIKKI